MRENELNTAQNKIFVVIVTYSNRFHLLKQSIDAALKEGVYKIIVVDNYSHPDSREKLKAYEQSLPNKLNVITLDENTGSSGGFKRGIEAVCKDPECDFVWLLDDDNVVQEEALSSLLNIYNAQQSENHLIALSSYRVDTTTGRDIVQKGIIRRYKANNFGGFNFIATVKRKLSGLFSAKNPVLKRSPVTSIELAAYGGLFLPRKTIELIGLPNEDYFVYVDDQDYSYRIVKNGGKLWYCASSMIKDVDEAEDNTINAYLYFRQSTSEMKMYYTIRNQVYFGKQFKTNNLMYFGNMWAKLLILGLFSLSNIKLMKRRLRLIMRAIRDGHLGNMGKTFGDK